MKKLRFYLAILFFWLLSYSFPANGDSNEIWPDPSTGASILIRDKHQLPRSIIQVIEGTGCMDGEINDGVEFVRLGADQVLAIAHCDVFPVEVSYLVLRSPRGISRLSLVYTDDAGAFFADNFPTAVTWDAAKQILTSFAGGDVCEGHKDIWYSYRFIKSQFRLIKIEMQKCEDLGSGPRETVWFPSPWKKAPFAD